VVRERIPQYFYVDVNFFCGISFKVSPALPIKPTMRIFAQPILLTVVLSFSLSPSGPETSKGLIVRR